MSFTSEFSELTPGGSNGQRDGRVRIGYTPVSTESQDLTSQRNALATLGVDEQRAYVNQDLTDTS